MFFVHSLQCFSFSRNIYLHIFNFLLFLFLQGILSTPLVKDVKSVAVTLVVLKSVLCVTHSVDSVYVKKVILGWLADNVILAFQSTLTLTLL